MMDRDPMVGPPPEQIPLPAAPLVRVLAQVRFPPILKIDQDRAFVAGFQEAIRAHYPFLVHEMGQQVSLGPAQAVQVRFETASVWRFADASVDWKWRVSLGPDFLTLETAAYRSRDDFVDRLAVLFEAAEQTLQPGPATRIGLRYVDRLTGQALEDVRSFLDPSVLGVTPTPLGAYAQLNVSEVLLAAPEEDASVRMRFGLLPVGITTDPATIEPVGEKSWILDLDMFDDVQRPFSASLIEGRTRAFAERIYSLFRALVTPAFLKHYGGEP